jgi:hypothetical protein
MESLRLFSFSPPVFTMPFSLVFPPFLFSFVQSLERERAAGSSFVERVFHILSVRANPEMFRIYASWIVASVTDAFAVWNRAFELFEDNSVREAGSIAFVFPRNLPIAFVVQGTLVIPASGFEIDFDSQQHALPREERFNH